LFACKGLDDAAAAAADPENNMNFARPGGGRGLAFVPVMAAIMIVLRSAAGMAAGSFPFDQEMLLDAAPMPPAKRVPVLTVAADGEATIDLWCRTVTARVTISGSAIHIEPAPLPEALPQYMSDGQCTPERMQADADTLAALAQATSWRLNGDAVLLNGAAPLRFVLSSH
jgi:heat shock protein HslJ